MKAPSAPPGMLMLPMERAFAQEFVRPLDIVPTQAGAGAGEGVGVADVAGAVNDGIDARVVDRDGCDRSNTVPYE